MADNTQRVRYKSVQFSDDDDEDPSPIATNEGAVSTNMLTNLDKINDICGEINNAEENELEDIDIKAEVDTGEKETHPVLLTTYIHTFTCNLCHQSFERQHLVEAHLISSHDLGEQTGLFTYLTSVKKQKKRMWRKEKDSFYHCKHCHFRARRAVDIHHHEKQQHRNVEEPLKNYACKLCKQKFALHHIFTHMEEEHGNYTDDMELIGNSLAEHYSVDSQVATLPDAGDNPGDQSDFGAMHVDDIAPQDSEHHSQSEVGSKSTNVKYFHCPQCHFKTKSERGLQSHQRMQHHDEQRRTASCNDCGQPRSRNALHVCSKIRNRKRTLRRDGEGKFMCADCDFRHKVYTSMYMHTKIKKHTFMKIERVVSPAMGTVEGILGGHKEGQNVTPHKDFDGDGKFMCAEDLRTPRRCQDEDDEEVAEMTSIKTRSATKTHPTKFSENTTNESFPNESSDTIAAIHTENNDAQHADENSDLENQLRNSDIIAKGIFDGAFDSDQDEPAMDEDSDDEWTPTGVKRTHTDDKDSGTKKRRLYGTPLKDPKSPNPQKTDSGSFKCNFCDFESKYNQSCEKHQWRHTGFAPFKCELCNMGFTSKQRLGLHTCTEQSTVDGDNTHQQPSDTSRALAMDDSDGTISPVFEGKHPETFAETLEKGNEENVNSYISPHESSPDREPSTVQPNTQVSVLGPSISDENESAVEDTMSQLAPNKSSSDSAEQSSMGDSNSQITENKSPSDSPTNERVNIPDSLLPINTNERVTIPDSLLPINTNERVTIPDSLLPINNSTISERSVDSATETIIVDNQVLNEKQRSGQNESGVAESSEGQESADRPTTPSTPASTSQPSSSFNPIVIAPPMSTNMNCPPVISEAGLLSPGATSPGDCVVTSFTEARVRNRPPVVPFNIEPIMNLGPGDSQSMGGPFMSPMLPNQQMPPDQAVRNDQTNAGNPVFPFMPQAAPQRSESNLLEAMSQSIVQIGSAVNRQPLGTITAVITPGTNTPEYSSMDNTSESELNLSSESVAQPSHISSSVAPSRDASMLSTSTSSISSPTTAVSPSLVGEPIGLVGVTAISDVTLARPDDSAPNAAPNPVMPVRLTPNVAALANAAAVASAGGPQAAPPVNSTVAPTVVTPTTPGHPQQPCDHCKGICIHAMYRCYLCRISFEEKTMYNRHIAHHAKSMGKCQVCNQVFRTPAAFDGHLHCSWPGCKDLPSHMSRVRGRGSIRHPPPQVVTPVSSSAMMPRARGARSMGPVVAAANMSRGMHQGMGAGRAQQMPSMLGGAARPGIPTMTARSPNTVRRGRPPLNLYAPRRPMMTPLLQMPRQHLMPRTSVTPMIVRPPPQRPPPQQRRRNTQNPSDVIVID